MKLKLWTFVLLIAIFLIAIAAKPAVLEALGIGQSRPTITDASLAKLTEQQMNDKYGATFQVHSLTETQVGARFQTVISEKTLSNQSPPFFFHAAAFKVADYFRIQDDYELQRLVRPIVDDVMGSDIEFIYDLTYASPSLFTHIDNINMDWNQLLKNREREHIELELSMYAPMVSRYDLAQKFTTLKKRLQQEHLSFAGLHMYRVDAANFDTKLLTMKRKDLAKVIREVHELAENKSTNESNLKSTPFTGFQ
ncbi:hypothetical protein [Saccharibacillus sp. JS10]|uniref:hypothetical protein n=1 Tax=Saccharibacillus sp. JS10 TaxID=2950552 RepID=UPI002108CC49|nr:hypothetical protein [Saccharibacillus sp. JS10]MCQ4086604.1 hypothetical protein [Saccharibacillus sp. JS10]